MKTKLTKLQRKGLAYKEYVKITDPAWKEYDKIKDPAYKEYLKKLEEIDNEVDEVEQIIEHNGHKYKLIEEQK